MSEEVTILAKTIFGEAHAQKLSAMEAIANVVMNRVRHAQKVGSYWWGMTPKEVCLKPLQFKCWQYTDYLDPKKDETLKNNKVYKVCERLAKRAITGFLKDNTKGATHFHHLDEHPAWAAKAVPCAQIGGFLFYAHV